ncbi:hypothetical protein GF351_00590 [Candidatus Woesearchaeota archaeon]|nr:hypothetical protein [Candidatus Woesearchaeota archaeon]
MADNRAGLLSTAHFLPILEKFLINKKQARRIRKMMFVDKNQKMYTEDEVSELDPMDLDELQLHVIE